MKPGSKLQDIKVQAMNDFTLLSRLIRNDGHTQRRCLYTYKLNQQRTTPS